MPPLRVLVLHGFGQNAAVFIEKRAKDLLKKLKDVAVVNAMDAPHALPYDSSLRGWWSYPDWDGRAETIQALADELLQRQEFECVGIQDSLELVLKEWRAGSYDGLIGFSQGAVMAAAACAELEARARAGDVGTQLPRFAVLISGFGRPVPRGLSEYPPKEPLRVPSLHIWGAADTHIPPWASEALLARFVDGEQHAHAGGHFMPQKGGDVTVVQKFLTKFLAKDAAASACPTPSTQASSPVAAAASPRSAHTAPEAASKACSGASLGRVDAADELQGALARYGRPSSGAGESAAAAAASSVASPAPLGVCATAPAAAAGAGYLDEELAAPGPGTYERLLALLRTERVPDFLQLGPHEPCRTSEDSVRVRTEAMLLAAPKGLWLLAVMPADMRLSWKKVRALHGKGTRMATEEEVRDVAGCIPGAVPPFAAAFPKAVTCLADQNLPDVINFNCGLRTRSIQLTRAEFERVQQPNVVDIAE
eukprot:TRINITY_DN14449_c0_g1_i2.p1 TRINITY_DN14449_c0_g1~~TRINITY_DN14449_c0_g1_i2.p1  ORF type:complete len:480 (-),score=116.85 TRINITY_DN14449_c0_g1_i2:113-1552(-)